MHKRMKDINYYSIFDRLDKVTGLPFKRKGRKWHSASYVDGTPHKRWDKTTSYMKGGKIIIVEQGSPAIDIWQMFSDRGMTDLQVGNFLRSETDSNYVTPAFVEPPTSYVYNSCMNKTLHKYSDNLFKFLCTLFPVSRVKEAYDLYKVGSRGDNPVFWCINKEGQIGHDKEMPYILSTGKRDKRMTMTEDGREIMLNPPKRVYKTKYGFTSTPAFGEHLLKKYSSEKVYCVESEKSALLFFLMYRKLCLGLGGSSCLFKAPEDSILLGDKDDAGYRWLEKGAIKWWESYEVPTEDGDDIGDVIIKLRKNLVD